METAQSSAKEINSIPQTLINGERYANCIAASKRVRWDIDTDVIRGRQFDFGAKFLPDGLSLNQELTFFTEEEKRLLSQIQGRTYANMFGLVERFICAKVVEVSRDYVLGDQVALEALVRFSDEELKHQELFRRLEVMAGEQMPAGYQFLPQPNDVAGVVLGKSTWAVLGLTLHIELFTQVHYRKSIEKDPMLSELWKDVFRFHWLEESQHAILDELEWVKEDQQLNADTRDRAVDELIELVAAVDGIVQMQAKQDADFCLAVRDREPSSKLLTPKQVQQVHATVLKAYRWQYIVSGVQLPRFQKVLTTLVNDQQMQRIGKALQPIVAGF